MSLRWLNYLLAAPNIPQTISVPFGAGEKDVPREYATTICNLFARLGVRGVSILFASGDDGADAGKCVVDGNFPFFIPVPRILYMWLFTPTCD